MSIASKQQLFDLHFDIAMRVIEETMRKGGAIGLHSGSSSDLKVFAWIKDVASRWALDHISPDEIEVFAKAQAALVMVSWAVGTKDPATIESVGSFRVAGARKVKEQGALPAGIVDDVIRTAFEQAKAAGQKKIGHQIAKAVNTRLAEEAERRGVKYEPKAPESIERRYRRISAGNGKNPKDRTA